MLDEATKAALALDEREREWRKRNGCSLMPDELERALRVGQDGDDRSRAAVNALMRVHHAQRRALDSTRMALRDIERLLGLAQHASGGVDVWRRIENARKAAKDALGVDLS